MPTDIKVQRLHRLSNNAEDKPLKAFADIVVNDAILVRGVRILSSKRGGFFVAMPREQSTKDKKWYDSVKCLNPEIAQRISEEVLRAYGEQNV